MQSAVSPSAAAGTSSNDRTGLPTAGSPGSFGAGSRASGSDKKSIVQGHDFAVQEKMLAPRATPVQLRLAAGKPPVQRVVGDEKKTVAPVEAQADEVDADEVDAEEVDPELGAARAKFGTFVGVEVEKAKAEVAEPNDADFKVAGPTKSQLEAAVKKAAPKNKHDKGKTKQHKEAKEALAAHVEAAKLAATRLGAAQAKYAEDVAAAGDARKAELDGFVAGAGVVGEKGAMHIAMKTAGKMELANALRALCAKSPTPTDTDIADEVLEGPNPIPTAAMAGSLVEGGYPVHFAVEDARLLLGKRGAEKDYLKARALREKSHDDLLAASAFLVKHAARAELAREVAEQAKDTWPRWTKVLSDVAGSGDEAVRWLLSGHATRPTVFAKYLGLVVDQCIGRGGADALMKCIEVSYSGRYIPYDLLVEWVTRLGATTAVDMMARTEESSEDTELGGNQVYMEQSAKERGLAKTKKGEKLEEKAEHLVMLEAAFARSHAVPTVYQGDKHYVGAEAYGIMDGRTGFQRHKFEGDTLPQGEAAITVEIHAHWNRSDGKLTSAHIQDKAKSNGEEINQNADYPETTAAIAAGFNKASGDKRPKVSDDVGAANLTIVV